jgi:hypothetical protein
MEWRASFLAATARGRMRDTSSEVARGELTIALPLVAAARDPRSNDDAWLSSTAFVLSRYLESFEEELSGPILPYGLALQRPTSGGCGERKHGDAHWVSPCGTAFVLHPMLHRFVGLLAK